MTEVEVETIHGVCSEITEKNGWTNFVIDIGRQYPVRVETKLSHLINAGRAVGQQKAAWTFKKSDGAINPNSGKPYINRLLEKVELVSGDSPAPSRSSDSEKMTKAEWNDKDRRDYRSRAWAQTISLFSPHISLEHLLEANFQETSTAMQRWHRFIYKDITGTFAYPEDESDIPFKGGDTKKSPADEDDGIPF